MPDVGELTVRLTALTAEFNAAMQGSQQSVAGWQDIVKKATIGAGAAFAAMSAELGHATSLAGEQLRAEKQLALAFHATGQAVNTDALKEFAAQLQSVSNFGDETTIKAMALLASFRLNEQQIRTLTPRIQDVAEFMGVDLATAANMVGRSITTGTNALQRMGVAMTDTQEKAFAAADSQQRVAMMAELMQQKVGGAAQTLATPFKQFQNALHDMQEQIGMLVREDTNAKWKRFTEMVSTLTDFIRRLNPETKAFIGHALTMAVAVTGIATTLGGIALVMPTVISGFQSMATALLAVSKVALPLTAILASIIASVGAIKIIGETGGLAVMIGARERTSEEEAARSKYYDKTGGGFMSTVGLMMSEGAKTIMQPLMNIADGVLPKLDENLGKTAAAANGTAGALGAFARRTMDFETNGGVTMGPMVLTEGGALLDEGVASIAEAAKRIDQQSAKLADSIGHAFNEALSEKSVGGASALTTGAGETTAIGGAYNWLADTIGPQAASNIADGVGRMVDSIQGAFDVTADDLMTVAGSLGRSVVRSAGTLGDVAEASMKGMQAGPWGALAAVVATLFTKSEGFKEIVALANQGFGDIARVLGTFARALGPLSVITNQVVGFLVDQLMPVFEALNSVIGGAFFYVIKYVTLGIAYVIKGIGMIWNGIVGAIAWFFDKIDDVLGWFGVDTDLGGAIRRATINMNGLNRAIDKLNNTTLDQADAAAREADETDRERDATEQLLNLPQGYKIAVARYNAAVAEDFGNQGGSGGADSGLGSGGNNLTVNNTVIENVVIVSDNPEEVWRGLRRVISRDSFVRSGSGYGGRGPYSTPLLAER